MANSTNLPPEVRAFVICDRIYRDADTRKYVLAGVFNRIFAPVFPWAYPGGCGVYFALTGIRARLELALSFKEASSNTVLMETQISVSDVTDPLAPVEFHVMFPPLPLPQAGHYSFELSLHPAGVLLRTLAIQVKSRPSAPEGDHP